MPLFGSSPEKEAKRQAKEEIGRARAQVKLAKAELKQSKVNRAVLVARQKAAKAAGNAQLAAEGKKRSIFGKIVPVRGSYRASSHVRSPPGVPPGAQL